MALSHPTNLVFGTSSDAKAARTAVKSTKGTEAEEDEIMEACTFGWKYLITQKAVSISVQNPSDFGISHLYGGRIGNGGRYGTKWSFNRFA
jgi:hypothetical protein